MSAYHLRTAQPADVPDVLAFWLLAAENTDRHDTAPTVLALLARDPDALILTYDGQRLVGSVIAGWDGWRAHLYRFAVHPGYRRRGLGRTLLAAAERRFVALGGRRADAVVLDVVGWPQRGCRSLRTRAFAARTSGWRALALRQRR